MVFEVKGVRPLDAKIAVRLTSEEKTKLQDDAGFANLSISELVRRRYFGRKIVANADLAMIKELRRVGGLLKHVHVESGGAYSSATADAILELKLYIQKLSKK